MPTTRYRQYSLGRHMTKKRSKSRAVTRSKSQSKEKNIGPKRTISKGKSGVQVLIMREGALLFHGHPEAKEWVIPHNRPAFFGGTMVALYYADHQPEYVSTYVLKKNAHLLDLGSLPNYGKFYKTLKSDSERWTFSRVTGYNIASLSTESCSYKGKRKNAIRFCTEDFIEPEDEKQDNYAMLRFAKLICEHGFDGYYIPPVFRRAYESKGKDQFLTEQIILCKPRDLVLKISQLSIQAVASNMKKSKRRKR